MSFALPLARARLISSPPTFLIPFLSFTLPVPLRTSSPLSLLAIPLPAALQLPSLGSLFPDGLSSLRELLPGWVLAVPKSKTTHSAKRMRSANKGLKEQQSALRPFAPTHSCLFFLREKEILEADGWFSLALLFLDIVACPSCGTPKRMHHLCHECHVDYRREYHAEAKEKSAGEGKELEV